MKNAKQDPITDLGKVLRLDSCARQRDMCWGYNGFVLAHKDVNPGFDLEKPYVVVMNQDDGAGWQMHFENFGKAPRDEKALDDIYRAVAKSCRKGMGLALAGGATPGGISGLSKLAEYGFKKFWMPDDASVYWGGELDPAKLEKWLNSGRHDGDFLVRTDSDVTPGEGGGAFAAPGRYNGEVTAKNTKPRPFKMVKESGRRPPGKAERQILYWAHMLDGCKLDEGAAVTNMDPDELYD